MKRAECLEIRPRALQGKIRADDFYDVVSSGDLLDCFRRDRSHGRGYFLLVLTLEAMPNLRSAV